MPNQQPTYREQVDAQRIIQIREILKGLPQACGDFIRSIAVTTRYVHALGVCHRPADVLHIFAARARRVC